MKPAAPVTRRFMRASLEKTLEALTQPVAPVWKTRRALALAAEDGVRWPRRRSREVHARDPADTAVDAGVLEDRLREFGPGAVTVGGGVPDSRRQVQHDPGRSSEMPD